MTSDFLWCEKYRPKTIEDCILPEQTKKSFQDFLNSGELPNLLLCGPAGVGKTTVAKALCNELGVDCYVINGSDEGRFLDTVRNNAKNLPDPGKHRPDLEQSHQDHRHPKPNDPRNTNLRTRHQVEPAKARLAGCNRETAHLSLQRGFDETADDDEPEACHSDFGTERCRCD